MVLDTPAYPGKAAGTAQAAEPDRVFKGFFDIPLQLRVELGRRRCRCADVIALRVGAIVALDRSAGENVTILLNGNRIGAGEIVVIEDSMGLRITDIGVRDHGRDA